MTVTCYQHLSTLRCWLGAFGWVGNLSLEACSAGNLNPWSRENPAGWKLAWSWLSPDSQLWERHQKVEEITSHYNIIHIFLLYTQFFLNTQVFFLRELLHPLLICWCYMFNYFNLWITLKPSEDGLKHWLRRDTQPARGIRSPVFTSGFMIFKPVNVPELNWTCCHFSAEACNIMQYYNIIHCLEIARFCVLLALTGICVCLLPCVFGVFGVVVAIVVSFVWRVWIHFHV